jgi:hypothetical protein
VQSMSKPQPQSSRVEQVIDRAELEVLDRPGTHAEHVYILRFGEGPVKIGYSSNIGARLRVIGASHWEPLTMVGAIMGNRSTERALHDRLRADRIGRTEWFKPSASVLDVAKGIASGELPEDVKNSIEWSKDLDIEGLFIGTKGNPCPCCGFAGVQPHNVKNCKV